MDTAIRLRDAALIKLEKDGVWKDWGKCGPHLQWTANDGKETMYTVLLSTPFQKDEKFKNYELDIWVNRKVLSILWKQDRNITVISFRRGDWEKMVLAWGKTEI